MNPDELFQGQQIGGDIGGAIEIIFDSAYGPGVGSNGLLGLALWLE